MAFQLMIIQGRSASKAVRLGDGPATMGREAGCQVRINSSLVSRKHCQVYEKKGHLLVKDLGSSNGTYVNGKRVSEQQVLEVGDELTIGPIRFRVEKFELAAAAAGVAKASEEAVLTGTVDKDPDEFEITFDDDAGNDDNTQLLGQSPITVAKAQPSTAAGAVDTDAPIPVGDSMGDDQVADFLLGIELDDDDKG